MRPPLRLHRRQRHLRQVHRTEAAVTSTPNELLRKREQKEEYADAQDFGFSLAYTYVDTRTHTQRRVHEAYKRFLCAWRRSR
jgi:hypothetical protein